MLGSMIRANLLTVKTSNKMDNFAIPVRKNGKKHPIHFWLGVVLPLNLSSSRQVLGRLHSSFFSVLTKSGGKMIV